MVSSKDVAKLAGVSQSTVSRVLNTPEKVRTDKYDKVVKAMEELNYRPNAIARSLVKKQTKSIALISGPIHNPFFAETTTSIVNYCKSKGYNTNVHFEVFGDNSSIIKDVSEMQVDGIILSSILMDDKIYYDLKALNIPFVMFNRKHNEPGNYFEMDNILAGQQVTEHLLEINHQDIVWIGGPLNMSTFHGRYEGFRLSMKAHGLTVGTNNTFITDTSEQGIRDVVKDLMSKRHRPTAIFAATDSIAIFILDFLLEKGYRVPEDVSLIGIDNTKLSQHHSVQLTTVGTEQCINLGQVAIETLIDQIETGKFELTQKTYSTKLFNRSTTRAI
ncbi:LacI family DNA-binding transcriptional regulator [Piscibacillus sp. B03]|uniref:LacI family DNA-binding transcriptional regulator n=1 Tax=Piscibacillus sp. B03 TaxID=3457430 RepID=UPI003FCE4447